jgi:cell division septum initiation protein DivIVA
MAGEKRFGTSLFGFKKADVNQYIEIILKEFDEKLKEKDEEINSLKSHGKEIKAKLEDFILKSEQINEDRSKIAEVLIKAQEKADMIVEDARIQAIDEKKKLEEMIEGEKEKLVDMKAEIKILKAEVINTLKKYEGSLSDMIAGNSEE